MSKKLSIRVFFQMLKKDLLTFRREYPGKAIDTCILFFTNLCVFSFFMSGVGIKESYAPFILVGSWASFGLFEVVGQAGILMSDIKGEKVISHKLTMPISSKGLFSYIAIYWGLTSLLLTIPLIFLGKLILFDRFDLTKINYFQFIPMMILTNMFYGFFSLWMSGILKGINSLTSLYLRFINPIFMFGAYFYSWKDAYDLSPIVAYITLINPMVYIMEGMRASALGGDNFLPFWIDFPVIIVFILGLFWHGSRRLKKELDCL